MDKNTILLESLIEDIKKQNERLNVMRRHLSFTKKEIKKLYWQNERTLSKIHDIRRLSKRGNNEHRIK